MSASILFTKHNIFIIITAVCLLIASIKHLETNKKSDFIFIDCLSTASTSDDKNYASQQMWISFFKNGTGEINFNGKVANADALVFNLSRTIRFEYHSKKNYSVVLTNYSTVRASVDNVPENIFNHLIFDTKKENISLFIKKIDNAYIFSNYFSPMLMCVEEIEPPPQHTRVDNPGRAHAV